MAKELTKELADSITIQTMKIFGLNDLSWIYDCENKPVNYTCMLSTLGIVYGIMGYHDELMKEVTNNESSTA